MKRSVLLSALAVIPLSMTLALLIPAVSTGVRAQADAGTTRPVSLGGGDTLAQGLGSLPLLTPMRSRSISAENPTGAKGRGGMAVPDLSEKEYPDSGRAADVLGQGWKVRPFLRV